MMRIILTGVAGFIGSNLSERLLKEGHVVIGVDNFITGARKNIEALLKEPGFEFYNHDVINPFKINGNVDWIMHFASPASPPKYLKYPIETMRVNSEGTMNLLNLAVEKRAKFFLASTSEVYGDPEVHPQPECYWGNVNPNGERSCYDESKRYAEAMTYLMHRSYNLSVRVIRIFNTFGPKMDLNDGRVITNFIKQILEERPITIYGEGLQTRSFQYVDDLIEGIIRLMNVEYYSPVNLGNTEEMNMIQLAELIKEIARKDVKFEFLSLPQDDPKRRKPNLSVSNNILGWEPKVKVIDGLKKTLEYFQKCI